ncbi:MAG: ABC transporter ATP-binding protein/permease [Solobacterium sp.]|nr:ABC transporter ATP-binding protein/permease [Solobacterium sp.]
MIRKLAREIREYKGAAIATPLFMVGEVILELMLPYIMSIIVDRGVQAGDMSVITHYALIMIACAFASMFCGIMSGNMAAYASTGFVHNLRKDMFENIQKFSFANIDKFSTSGLMTRLGTDATNVQNAFMMVIRMGVRAPLTIIIAMFMTFTISPELAPIFLVALLFLAVCLSFITVKSYKRFSAVFRQYDDLNESVQENVTNIRVVKAYVKEEHEIGKFTGAVVKLQKLFEKAESLIVLNGPIMSIAANGSMLALSWFGARLIVGGTLGTGQLMSMFTYTMNILMGLMMLSMLFVMMTMSIASARRIVEVLDEKPSITNPESPVFEIADGSIDLNHVSFGYYKGEDKRVLSDIDLHIRSGETIGVIGATGSGKSTLTMLLPRLYDADEGEVMIGGHNVKDYDLTALRDSVAMVLQKNVLFSGTIKENLRWGREDATDEELIEVCRLASADDFIRSFENGYDTYIEQGGTNVSGGQKQRLCIARALLKRPKVLILDDSTSACDTATDARIRASFRTTLPDVTKIIISQRIASIEDADRVLVLDDGRISGFDKPENLLKENQIYQEIYETQKKGEQE